MHERKTSKFQTTYTHTHTTRLHKSSGNNLLNNCNYYLQKSFMNKHNIHLNKILYTFIITL